MSWKLIIEDVAPPIDGEYELDLETFVQSLKNKDLRRIKLMTGVRAGELQDALQSGDNDVMVALVAIFLERENKVFPEDVLWEAQAGAVRFEQVEVADASPPPISDSRNASSSSGAGSAETDSGVPTPVTLTPVSSGDPSSEPSTDSGRETFFSLLQAS